MKKLKLSLEAYNRAIMLGNARSEIELADSNDQLKLVVYNKSDSTVSTNRLKDVTNYIDKHFKSSEFKYLDKGSATDPLQVMGNKFFMKNVTTSRVMDDLDYIVTKVK